MSKTAENAIHASDLPVFYGAGTVASERPLRCSFRYNKGTIYLSPRLYELLDVGEYRRVSFIRYRRGLYITRNDNQETSFWINVHKGFKNQPKTLTIYDKNFVQGLMREWGYSLNDNVRVPVASFAVQPNEIGLESWPYPIYRLLIDQL